MSLTLTTVYPFLHFCRSGMITVAHVRSPCRSDTTQLCKGEAGKKTEVHFFCLVLLFSLTAAVFHNAILICPCKNTRFSFAESSPPGLSFSTKAPFSQPQLWKFRYQPIQPAAGSFSFLQISNQRADTLSSFSEHMQAQHKFISVVFHC